MKTAIAIRGLISVEYWKLNENTKLSDKAFSREQKKGFRKIDFLKFVLMYLETQPAESFIVSERERIKKVIKAKESQYEYWHTEIHFTHFPTRKLKTLFNKENGIPLLKKQLTTLNFILS